MIQLANQEWAFIPGPPEIPDPPASSLNQNEIAAYPPEAIAQALLAYPGFNLMQKADPSWWQWRAGWERGPCFLLVEMTLFETDPIAWGGSGVSGYCELEDLLSLWRALRERFPAIWLDNSDCEIHTPDSFARLMMSREAH
jgi:hypothetical protein